ncbi:MAG: prepilin-type N-terminal cleavage/methylation domain-containing protein [Actinomycetota bacterium]
MFQRFHEKLQEREGGFTLIELLVVILIIAILAAIAIPVFLNQRQKGWASQVESALKNAATAQESFLTDSATGEYATLESELEGEGFKKASDVTALTISTVGGTSYCMVAGHDELTETWAYNSAEGKPVKNGTCTVTS